MPRGPAAALATILLAAALAGCTAASDLQRFLDRAQGRPEFVEVERLNEEIPFALNDPPAPPPRQGHLTVLNFTVLPDSRNVRVEVTAVFDSSLPAGLPSGAPRGQVFAAVRSPAGEEGNVTFRENGAEEFTVEGPAPGEWGVELVSFGQGTIFVLAHATELRRD